MVCDPPSEVADRVPLQAPLRALKALPAPGRDLQLATPSASYLREVLVASGYLSSEPARVH